MRLISENVGGRSPVHAGRSVASIGIDFVPVAESHVLLFSRLKQYVRGESEDESDDFVEHARHCELREWLAGEGARRFGHLPEFMHLRDIHERFHDEARAVLDHLHAGCWIAAERSCRNEFSQSLRAMLITLTELHEAIRKGTRVPAERQCA